MARVVHKYEVVGAGAFDTVPMPIGAEILHADAVASQVFVWALVEQGAVPLINRRFGYFGTGHVVPEDSRFVATGIDRGWNLVWHIFEEMPGEGGSGAEVDGDQPAGGSAAPGAAAGAVLSSAPASGAASTPTEEQGGDAGGLGQRPVTAHVAEAASRGASGAASLNSRTALSVFGFDYWTEVGVACGAIDLLVEAAEPRTVASVNDLDGHPAVMALYDKAIELAEASS